MRCEWLFIAQRDNTKYTTLKFRNHAPEPEAVMFLRFHLDGPLYHANTPLLFQVRPLSENFLLEIFGVLIFSHIHFFSLYLILGIN